MATLINIRDSIKDFLAKYEKFAIPVLKFAGMLLVLMSYSNIMGYSTQMNNLPVKFILSLISAFMPVQIMVLIAGLAGLLHMYAVGIDIAAVYLVMFALMYLLYMRFAPKHGWIIMILPFLYMLKLHYMIPIVISIFVGPVGIVPMIFGVVFYYFAVHVSELVALLATASEESSIQGFSYVINAMLSDKAMLLTILVFVLVIAVTYIIYRQSFEYSWLISIGTGTILGIILFLVGGIVLEAEINILVIFLGSIGGAVLAVIAQFFKGVLDYSRTETVQFEDDEYYYYVKAVPKVKVSEQNVKVQKISTQTVHRQAEESIQTVHREPVMRQRTVRQATENQQQTTRRAEPAGRTEAMRRTEATGRTEAMRRTEAAGRTEAVRRTEPTGRAGAVRSERELSDR